MWKGKQQLYLYKILRVKQIDASEFSLLPVITRIILWLVVSQAGG